MAKTIEEALRFGKGEVNGYWPRAFNNEMSKVKVPWQWVDGVNPEQAISGSVKELTVNQEINYHTIFDVRIDFQ